MKNIFLLPTEESSRIGRFVDTQKLILRSEKDIPRGENLNIYITSEEEVNVNDYVIVSCSEEEIEEVRVVTGYYNEQFLFDGKSQIHMNYCKKIIFTTDFRLAPNVQKIDDEFLEWFVNNPTCDFVEVRDIRTIPALQLGSPNGHLMYKIIIPQEEPKQKLDCPYDFTSRCTMGRCDCKPKQIFPSHDDTIQQILTAHKVPKEYFGRQEESKPLDNLEERFKRDMSMIVMPLDNDNIPEEPKQKFSRKWKELKDAKPSEPLKSWDDESEEEALEKAATNYSHDWHTITGLDSDDVSPFGASIIDFIAGARYQAKRMYSEEEVEHLIHLAVFQSHCGVKDRVKIPNSNECAGFVNKWFEQFKKK
jgi:hypothetical protein